MYLSRSHTGNIFPPWTVVVWRHHVYVREFHRPSCNSVAVETTGTLQTSKPAGTLSTVGMPAIALTAAEEKQQQKKCRQQRN
jgi:hypothetical protein